MENNIHGIKGNIYVGSDTDYREERIFNIIERVTLGLFCLTATAVLVAQIILHI